MNWRTHFGPRTKLLQASSFCPRTMQQDAFADLVFIPNFLLHSLTFMPPMTLLTRKNGHVNERQHAHSFAFRDGSGAYVGAFLVLKARMASVESCGNRMRTRGTAVVQEERGAPKPAGRRHSTSQCSRDFPRRCVMHKSC